MPIEIVPRTAGPRQYSAKPSPSLPQGGIVDTLIDSLPDEGPPPDARDTNSPNFGMGLSTMEVYEILTPLAEMIAEQTGEPVQLILQEMVTDPTAIGRAKSMLGMDPTTPFPNNIREPMPSEELMGQIGALGAGALAGMPPPYATRAPSEASPLGAEGLLEGLRGQDRLDKMHEMGMLNEPADPSMVYDPRQEEERKMYMFEKMNPPPMSIEEKIMTFLRSGFSEKEAAQLAITGQQ